MLRTTLQLFLMVVCLNAAWGKATTARTALQQPRTVFVVGPGTILSVHFMDLPFVAPYYAIRYRTDDGELIEVCDSRGADCVVGGDAWNALLLYPS